MEPWRHFTAAMLTVTALVMLGVLRAAGANDQLGNLSDFISLTAVYIYVYVQLPLVVCVCVCVCLLYI